MEQNKLCGLLGIAKKAGYLLSGTDIVLDQVRSSNSKVVLVLIAENASPNTVKKVKNGCTYYHVPMETVPLDTEILGKTVGKKGLISTVGLMNPGIAEAVLKLLSTKKDQTEWEDKV